MAHARATLRPIGELHRPRPASVWTAVAIAVALAPDVALASPGAVPASLRAGAAIAATSTVRVLVQLAVPASALAGSAARSGPPPAAIASLQETLAAEVGTVKGRAITRRFRTIPWVAMEVDAAGLDALEAAGSVLAVTADRWSRPALIESVPLVGAPAAWASGFDGSGWAVAVLDTGSDRTHPFLAGRIVSEACFAQTQTCPNGESTQIGTGSAAPCDYDDGACEHGTHVAGIVAGGNEEFSGVARGASIVAIQVFTRLSGAVCGEAGSPCALSADSDQIAGLERVLELQAEVPIAAVNMSLGADGGSTSQAECDLRNPAMKAVIDQLRDAGVATVIAAGNGGLSDATSEPSCISSAIAVGATTKEDAVATAYSNSAPFLALLAPGDHILSSISPAPPGIRYAYESGTSQATPHVAAAFAILRQRQPGASVDELLAALRSSGVDIADPRNGIVTPRIAVDAALAVLGAGADPASGLQLTPEREQTLVSKPVGAEQWAISENHDDGSVTGNIFYPDGRAPKFVACQRLGDDGHPDPAQRLVTYSCQGSSPCVTSACPAPGDWSLIGDAVQLPASFFLPRAGLPASVPVAGAGSAATAVRAAPLADAASGLQLTPDGRRTLISKPVGEEQWAITRNPDGTVTGNVFYPDGREPRFLACDQTGDDGHPDPAQRVLTFDCRGSARCAATTCPGAEDWQTIDRGIELPLSFFLPR